MISIKLLRISSQVKELSFARPCFGHAGSLQKLNVRSKSRSTQSGHKTSAASSGPRFKLSGSNVNIIYTPEEFFNRLQSLVKGAKTRIALTSLYLGAGSKEQELVSNIKAKLSSSDGKMDVQFLFDFTRGSRGANNSRTILLPLIGQYPSNVSLSLFHSPLLRGLRKLVVPERYNEVFSVQHMKIYLVDDSVIISGANLSDQYFINRQDRYIMIQCRRFADFCHELIGAVSAMSYHVNADNQISLSSQLNSHPYLSIDGGRRFREEGASRLKCLLEQWQQKLQAEVTSDNTPDTSVMPLLQMAPFHLSMEETYLVSLLSSLGASDDLHLASGYFNLTKAYRNALISQCKASVNILAASAEANGFFGAVGVSGAIPSAYTYLAQQFMSDVESRGQQGRVRLLEYSRGGWTFHAKGLWAAQPLDGGLPHLTVIGSSNFGYRSMYRDLEIQVAIQTSNLQLQRQLLEERDKLYRRASPVTSHMLQHRVQTMPTWITLSTPVIRNFF